MIFEANGCILLETEGPIHQATPEANSTNRVLQTELVKWRQAAGHAQPRAARLDKARQKRCEWQSADYRREVITIVNLVELLTGPQDSKTSFFGQQLQATDCFGLSTYRKAKPGFLWFLYFILWL
ncbi:hypothetical protein HPB47_000206 [Ixodes persulcatus]|uniref:Uncharacterized protein n=1 Tax=Ixodes persulcatus TaxID=34615 RepID=A0AC60PUB8_IXOPE|nr:hypothetical protein HPB47_000206 [Ixodes persulcatus]